MPDVNEPRLTNAQADPARANRLGPMGFVLTFGVVSMLADVVYEGARSITGPFLATLGATGRASTGH
jgi:hypothetical protein